MDLMSFLNMHKIITTAGVLASSFVVTFAIRDLFEEVKITNKLIGQASYKASGEDGILNTEEKVRFIRDLGLEYSVQEGQKLLLSTRGEFVKFYLDSSDIGTLHRDNLKKYLGLRAEGYWISR